MNQLAPIVLFTYNRLKETKRTISALQNNFLAKESLLYIFSDGPKNENSVDKINEVRAYLDTVAGFKKVIIYKSRENKGLAKSIISGVTEIVNSAGKIIVLEDDLVTSTNFLDYMNQALNFYQEDEAIASISGYNLDLPSLSNSEDFYFGYRNSSWGWGTWKEKWNKVDWEMKDYDEFCKDKHRKKLFKRGGSDMLRMLNKQMTGKIDSWSIRFSYHHSKYDLKTVFPTKSKIINEGFGADATHTAGAKRFNTTLDLSGKRDFKFEKFKEMDSQLVKEFADKYSILNRGIDKLKRYFK